MKNLGKYTCARCGEEDYGKNPHCKCEREYEKSNKYNQPERSKREDSFSKVTEEWGCLFPIKVAKAKEMRCSELYGDIERPAETIWPA